jgi:hypothetical protein
MWHMAFGLESFKQSGLGRRIGTVVKDPQNVGDMIVFSRHGLPAVQAIGKALLALGSEVREDQVKKTIGRWVREILEPHGWTVWKKRRVAPGNLFSTGMVYRPMSLPLDKRVAPAADSPASPAERAAAWRESVKELPRTKPLSDQAISRETIYSDRG